MNQNGPTVAGWRKHLVGWFERLSGKPAGPAKGWSGGASRARAHVQNNRRWIVLDCETTGLDPAKDALLAIGAVAMVDGAIRLGDRFERTLQPPTLSSVNNVLVHGLGHGTQALAEAPETVLQAWQVWVADAPCIAFHAAFDRTVLERVTHQWLGRPCRSAWLDLAELGPAVDSRPGAKALDDWLARYGISVSPRHHASADALASAMLLQRWLAVLPPGERNFKSLQHRARNRRYLQG